MEFAEIALITVFLLSLSGVAVILLAVLDLISSVSLPYIGVSKKISIWKIKKTVEHCNCNVFLVFWQLFYDRPKVGDLVIVNDQYREIIAVHKLGWYGLKYWYNIHWEGNRDEPDPIDEEEDDHLESVA